MAGYSAFMTIDLCHRLSDLSTEVRRFAGRRHESLALLEARLERLAVAALVADDAGRYLFANRAAATLTGYDVATLKALRVSELTPSLNGARAALLWRQFIETSEQHGEYPLLVNGGRVVRVEYAAMTNMAPGLHISLLRAIEP